MGRSRNWNGNERQTIWACLQIGTTEAEAPIWAEGAGGNWNYSFLNRAYNWVSSVLKRWIFYAGEEELGGH